jgi:YHS domain-containing protein
MKMARAKCKICGTPLDTNTAYKITDKNGKNKYFCSATEFEAEEVRKQKAASDKDKVYRLICDILNEQEIINTALFKEWQVWLKVADNEKIGKYLTENKDYLTSVMTRVSSSEFARIRYLSAIIKDKIKGFVPKVEVVEKPKVVIDETIYDVPTHSLNKRRSLEDLEDMF